MRSDPLYASWRLVSRPRYRPKSPRSPPKDLTRTLGTSVQWPMSACLREDYTTRMRGPLLSVSMISANSMGSVPSERDGVNTILADIYKREFMRTVFVRIGVAILQRSKANWLDGFRNRLQIAI